MFQDNTLESQQPVFEDVPPPPPPPPEAPLFEMPLETKEQADLELEEILKLASPENLLLTTPDNEKDAFKEKFSKYKKSLMDKVQSIDKKIDENRKLNDFASEKLGKTEASIKSIPEKIESLEKKIMLLKKITNMGAKQKFSAEIALRAVLKSLTTQKITYLKTEEKLKVDIRQRSEKIEELASERRKARSKIVTLEKTITRLEGAEILLNEKKSIKRKNEDKKPLDGTQPNVSYKNGGRDDYEGELCNMQEIFTNAKPKPGREIFYTEEQILRLQLAIFKPKDWGGDEAAKLENKLKRAIFLCKHDVKGLGKTPRKNIETILGIDVVGAYKAQQEEAKRPKLALKVKRADIHQESKEAVEQENASSDPINNRIKNQNQAPEQRDIGSPKVFNKRTRSSGGLELVEELKQLQESLVQAKRAKQEANEETERVKQETQHVKQEANRVAREIASEREAKNRAEAELAKLQSMPKRGSALTPNTRAKTLARRKPM